MCNRHHGFSYISFVTVGFMLNILCSSLLVFWCLSTQFAVSSHLILSGCCAWYVTLWFPRVLCGQRIFVFKKEMLRPVSVARLTLVWNYLWLLAWLLI